MDEHVHDVGLRIEAVVEDVFEDHGFCDRAVRVAHEIFEQREFPRLQFDQLATTADFACNQVQCEIAYCEPGRLRGLRGSPDERLNSSEQLGECERLGQVIVATGLQTLH